jgi:uncharacterized membrane protein
MDYTLDWITLLLRWAHVVTAIAWIGASFYFVWLDNSLKAPASHELQDKGVSGELWAVHGGGFYNPQKYLVAPRNLPEKLHWFYWESYSTWLSGFALLGFLYYLNASTYLIDKTVLDLTPLQAVLFSITFLIGSWVGYDLLCRSKLSANELVLGGVIYLFLVLCSYAAFQVFSGRAAMLHVGAMIGTLMTANVLMVIIPGQRKVVAQMRAGQAVNPLYGQRGKQRSVHNNYLTLPVLFAMLSSHYAFAYSHRYSWLLVASVLAAGVLMRHFFNERHKGHIHYWIWPLIALITLVMAYIISPVSIKNVSDNSAVSLAEIKPIIEQRCVSCHAGAQAGKGVLLQTEAQIRAQAKAIYAQAVQLKAMPMGNATQITPDERALLGAWVQGGAK